VGVSFLQKKSQLPEKTSGHKRKEVRRVKGEEIEGGLAELAQCLEETRTLITAES